MLAFGVVLLITVLFVCYYYVVNLIYLRRSMTYSSVGRKRVDIEKELVNI